VYGVPSSALAWAHSLLSARCGVGLVTDLDAPLPYHGIPSWLPAPANPAAALSAPAFPSGAMAGQAFAAQVAR
jgi:hypothetical protein